MMVLSTVPKHQKHSAKLNMTSQFKSVQSIGLNIDGKIQLGFEYEP